MSNPPSYRHRPSLIGGEREFVAHGNRLACHEGGSFRAVVYADIRRIRVNRIVASRHLPAHWRCAVTPARGRRMNFTSLHMENAKAPVEDRTQAMQAFTSELLQRAARKNPSIDFVSGKPLLVCLLWLAVYIILLGFIGVGAYFLVAAVFGMQAIVSSVVAFLAAGALVATVGIPLLRWVRDSWPRRFDPLADAPAS
ncbi:MAG TPA: hypothetical protein PL193_09685 [Xanthobacteraceae bacterium]|nr:hypothetical protein [Xanthobacteraceae bacterium]